jgi:hypothetical protein
VYLLSGAGVGAGDEAAVRELREKDRGEHVVREEGAGAMSDAVVTRQWRPKGNVSSVIAAQARRIEQLEADNALLRAYYIAAEIVSRYPSERGPLGFSPVPNPRENYEQARDALDAAGVMER